MRRVNHPSRLIALSAIALVVASCGGGGGSGGPCAKAYSLAFANAIGTAPSIPDRLNTCGVKVRNNGNSLERVTEAVIVVFNNSNNTGGVQNPYYWLWTKNTHYSTNGQARGDMLQVGDEWQLKRQSYVIGGQAFEDFELPLDFYIGWPISGSVLEKDSLHVSFLSRVSYPSDPDFGATEGAYWMYFKIKNGVVSGTVVHPPVIAAGTNATWQLVPVDDTSGYRIDWYWDSMLQSSSSNSYTFTKTMPVAGSYSLRIDQKLYDTTYTFNYNIVVPLNLQLSGPAVQMPSEMHQYSISVSGGTAPYSYLWKLNGSNYGTTSSVTTWGWNAYENHTLDVTVTDANSVVGHSSINIFVNNGECDPQEPGCNASLRASPISTKAPPKLPARRPTVQDEAPTTRRP
jgi:hypothetical protein